MEEERKGGAGSGEAKLVVIEHKGERHPRITIEGDDGKILDFHYLPAKARIEVRNGQKIEAGQMLARQPREAAGTMDITGGLPRVTEIFEARKPKDPSVLAEISGTVEIRSRKTPRQDDHDRPRPKPAWNASTTSRNDKELQVHAGDSVEAGDPAHPRADHSARHPPHQGRGSPLSIPAGRGAERLSQPGREDQRQAHRDHPQPDAPQGEGRGRRRQQVPPRRGASTASASARATNWSAQSVKIAEPGGTSFKEGDVVTKTEFKEANDAAEAAGKEPAKSKKPKPARAKTLLLGITKASLQSESFISAASFQETTKVLTEASLAGAVDTLVGLKENVILGHLIPAGTAFKPHLNLKIKHLAQPPQVEEITPAARAAAQAAAQAAQAQAAPPPSEPVPQAGV